MASAEVKLVPVRSCLTRRKGKGSWGKRGLGFSLYKYTLIHTDFVPDDVQYGLTCILCGKEDLYNATQAILHVWQHLPGRGKGFRNSTIMRDYLKPNGLTHLIERESKLKVDLGMYKLVISSANKVTELLVPELEDAEELMTCTNLGEVKAMTDMSMAGLAEKSEAFEEKVAWVVDQYLGTPKDAEVRRGF